MSLLLLFIMLWSKGIFIVYIFVFLLIKSPYLLHGIFCFRVIGDKKMNSYSWTSILSCIRVFFIMVEIIITINLPLYLNDPNVPFLIHLIYLQTLCSLLMLYWRFLNLRERFNGMSIQNLVYCCQDFNFTTLDKKESALRCLSQHPLRSTIRIIPI